jgi:tRNA pseudouridine38-40 synthase
MRIAFGVEYDGSRFSGWQWQRETRTVQDCVESAVSVVANAGGVRVHCAGRTDAGVHACEQVIHFDTQAARDPRSWVLGVNANLPDDVNVLWARPLADDFHARFSAHSRAYRYVILNRDSRSALLDKRAVVEHRPLELESMQRAAVDLVGQHDFSAFRAQGCQANSPIRTVKQVKISRNGPLIFVDIEANAFLQHMVRNIAGVLLAIGRGKARPGWLREVLETRDRSRGGITAPPHGLYLMRVGYPARFDLPAPLTAPAHLLSVVGQDVLKSVS